MSGGVPPEESDPLLTPDGSITVRDDAELRNHLHKMFGVDLNTAEERVDGMSAGEKRDLERRIRAYHEL